MKATTLANYALESYHRFTHYNPDQDVEALLETDGENQVLAFRGTETGAKGWLDVITDLRIIPWYDSRLKGFFHAGFLKAARSIEDDIFRDLSLEQPLYITGHSYGGALATIIAARLVTVGYQPAGVMTFGSPRVGFGRAAEILKDTNFYRVVCAGDSIASVPPWPYSHHLPEYTIPSPGWSDHKIGRYIKGLQLAGDVLEI